MAAVGGKIESVHRGRVALKECDLPADLNVHQMDELVLTADEGTPAVGEKGHAVQEGKVFQRKAPYFLRGLGIPESDRFIIAGGQNAPPVAGKGHRMNTAGVPLEPAEQFPG